MAFGMVSRVVDVRRRMHRERIAVHLSELAPNVAGNHVKEIVCGNAM